MVNLKMQCLTGKASIGGATLNSSLRANSETDLSTASVSCTIKTEYTKVNSGKG
jgi:hypothetical protein